MAALDLPSPLLHQLAERRVVFDQMLEKPGVVRADRQQLEDRLAVLSHDHGRRLALLRVLFQVRLRFLKVDHSHEP